LFPQIRDILRDIAGSERVEQYFYLHAGAAALGEGFGNLVGNGAVFVEVLRIGNAFARAADRFEHRRKYLIAIEQKLDPITSYDRGIGMGCERGIKGRFAEYNIRHIVDRGDARAARK